VGRLQWESYLQDGRCGQLYGNSTGISSFHSNARRIELSSSAVQYAGNSTAVHNGGTVDSVDVALPEGVIAREANDYVSESTEETGTG